MFAKRGALVMECLLVCGGDTYMSVLPGVLDTDFEAHVKRAKRVSSQAMKSGW